MHNNFGTVKCELPKEYTEGSYPYRSQSVIAFLWKDVRLAKQDFIQLCMLNLSLSDTDGYDCESSNPDWSFSSIPGTQTILFSSLKYGGEAMCSFSTILDHTFLSKPQSIYVVGKRILYIIVVP